MANHILPPEKTLLPGQDKDSEILFTSPFSDQDPLLVAREHSKWISEVLVRDMDDISFLFPQLERLDSLLDRSRIQFVRATLARDSALERARSNPKASFLVPSLEEQQLADETYFEAAESLILFLRQYLLDKHVAARKNEAMFLAFTKSKGLHFEWLKFSIAHLKKSIERSRENDQA